MEQQVKKTETGAQQQVQPNRTGIPARMKLEFESRSGLSLDGVRVHYNSPHPQSLNARAYTDGQNIFLGPGQESCLRHELGHIVQHSRRSVEPTCTVAGYPVNDSPQLEREADQLSAASGPFAGGTSPIQAGCIQRLCFREKRGNWVDVARELGAKEKIDFRRSLQGVADARKRAEAEKEAPVTFSWGSEDDSMDAFWLSQAGAGNATETSEEEDREIAELSETEAGKDTELSEAAKEITDLSEAEAEEVKSLDFEKYYEGINPNLKDKNFWINYESYATGDLTSLSAAVIGNRYHGIAMRWNKIGQYDKDKNLEVLRQFLGGERDEDGIVTGIGLQGIWRESETSDAQKEEGNYYRMETAGLHFFEAQKIWISLEEQQKETEQRAAGALKKTFADLARATVGAPKENDLKTQCLMAIVQMKFWITVSTPLGNRSLFNYYTEAYNCLDKMAEKTRGANAAADFLEIAAELHRVSLHLRAAKEFQKKKGSLLPNIVTPKIPMKRAFTDGTKLVAIGWNQQRRQVLRKAWGVESAGGKYPYDSSIKAWLSKRGVNMDQVEKKDGANQEVDVLWVRASGSNGGAHYENDTNPDSLKQRASALLRAGNTVFLAGDSMKEIEEYAQSNENGDIKLYNITGFWKNRMSELEAWGGNTRTGQFRLYDYLNRQPGSLVHIGAMSGNIEAMALLGHKVEAHVNSYSDQGVSRMRAYERHDQVTKETEDKIFYDIKEDKSYEQKNGKAYVALKNKSKKIYEIIRQKNHDTIENRIPQCPYNIFDAEHNPFLERRKDMDNHKRQILAYLWVDGLIHNKAYNDVWTRLNTEHPGMPQQELQKQYEMAKEHITKVVEFLKDKKVQAAIGINTSGEQDTGGNVCDKLQEQLLNYIFIQVVKE